MSYQPGHMGLAEGMALIFAATLAPVFLTTFPFSVDTAGPLAWSAPVISYLTFIILLYPLLYVLHHPSQDLYGACRELLGEWPARLIAVYYISVYLLDAVLLLRQFAENTLITALPALEFEAAIILYGIMSLILLYIGIESMAQTSYVLMPLLIAGLLLILTLAGSRYHFLFLTPWKGTGLMQVSLWGVRAGGINLGALLPFFLAASFQNQRTLRSAAVYGLGLSALLRTAAFVCYTATFGASVSREKLLPFYELARLVYLSRFVQRIEAFFIIVWSLMGMLNIAIDIFAALFLLCRLFDLPAMRPLMLPMVIIIGQLAMLPPAVTEVVVFYVKALFSYYNIGTLAIPLILFLAALIRKWREKA